MTTIECTLLPKWGKQIDGVDSYWMIHGLWWGTKYQIFMLVVVIGPCKGVPRTLPSSRRYGQGNKVKVLVPLFVYFSTTIQVIGKSSHKEQKKKVGSII